jgi:hypothetical protein
MAIMFICTLRDQLWEHVGGKELCLYSIQFFAGIPQRTSQETKCERKELSIHAKSPEKATVWGP